MFLQQTNLPVMFRALQGWRQLPLPHLLLLSLPCLGTSLAAPSGTWGQLEDRATHPVPAQGLSPVPSSPCQIILVSYI